jgi:hypothetical protein
MWGSQNLYMKLLFKIIVDASIMKDHFLSYLYIFQYSNIQAHVRSSPSPRFVNAMWVA